MVGSNNNLECDSIFRTLLLGSVPKASISGSAYVRRIQFADPKIGQIRLDFKQDPIHQKASILRWSLRRFRLQLIKTEKWIFNTLLLGQEISVFDLRCTSSFFFSFLIQKKVLFIIFQLFHNIWIRSLLSNIESNSNLIFDLHDHWSFKNLFIQLLNLCGITNNTSMQM
jgi:hypothetical protein